MPFETFERTPSWRRTINKFFIMNTKPSAPLYPTRRICELQTLDLIGERRNLGQETSVAYEHDTDENKENHPKSSITKKRSARYEKEDTVGILTVRQKQRQQNENRVDSLGCDTTSQAVLPTAYKREEASPNRTPLSGSSVYISVGSLKIVFDSFSFITNFLFLENNGINSLLADVHVLNGNCLKMWPCWGNREHNNGITNFLEADYKSKALRLVVNHFQDRHPQGVFLVGPGKEDGSESRKSLSDLPVYMSVGPLKIVFDDFSFIMNFIFLDCNDTNSLLSDVEVSNEKCLKMWPCLESGNHNSDITDFVVDDYKRDALPLAAAYFQDRRPQGVFLAAQGREDVSEENNDVSSSLTNEEIMHENCQKIWSYMRSRKHNNDTIDSVMTDYKSEAVIHFQYQTIKLTFDEGAVNSVIRLLGIDFDYFQRKEINFNRTLMMDKRIPTNHETLSLTTNDILSDMIPKTNDRCLTKIKSRRRTSSRYSSPSKTCPIKSNSSTICRTKPYLVKTKRIPKFKVPTLNEAKSITQWYKTGVSKIPVYNSVHPVKTYARNPNTHKNNKTVVPKLSYRKIPSAIPIPTKNQSSSNKREFSHIVSPLKVYITKTPKTPLISEIKTSDETPKYQDDVFRQLDAESKESSVIPLRNIQNQIKPSRLPKKAYIVSEIKYFADERSPKTIHGGQNIQRYFDINSQPTVIRHDGKASLPNNLQTDFLRNSGLDGTDDSLADLSLMEGNISLHTIKDAQKF